MGDLLAEIEKIKAEIKFLKDDYTNEVKATIKLCKDTDIPLPGEASKYQGKIERARAQRDGASVPSLQLSRGHSAPSFGESKSNELPNAPSSSTDDSLGPLSARGKGSSRGDGEPHDLPVPMSARPSKNAKSKTAGGASAKHKSKGSSKKKSKGSAKQKSKKNSKRGSEEPDKDHSTAADAASPLFCVRALESFKEKGSKTRPHLAFAKGAVIHVFKEDDDAGEYFGKLGKKEGWFPDYYVVKV